MKKPTYLSLLAIMLWGSLLSCSQHFITDSKEREIVNYDFAARKEVLTEGNLFDIFNRQLSQEESEALTFLYAYMPLSDLADYPGDFHLMNVQYAFKAREEMPWGEIIPEREFRHFVLPYRVNNENLDKARQVFYGELKDRVKNLSLQDAVLEVNHWCHEKVVYKPSDARTSSPLASVKTAYGRCGEESTFLVAALRSVGIPARQVYTPRWAHTDDNHAWVEAWVDGKWHFLGACEPEPVLDLGWFNAPAARGMLMHTKVFGHYDGPEEVIKVTPNYTEINVIDNYASTSKAEINVVDRNDQPIEGAKVEFKIYNYAEFYTAVSKMTDKDGKTSLTAGKGDMLVWASKDGKFGYGKLSFGKTDILKIVLDKTEGEAYSLPLEVIPPVEKAINVPVSEEQRAENTIRMEQEDSIRNAYVSTFLNEERIKEFAKETGTDVNELLPLLSATRGNYQEIMSFLSSTTPEQRPLAIRLLKVISEKDLRDTPASVLTDHLLNTPEVVSPLFDQYVLNPRITYEMLTPYKLFFKQNIDKELAEGFVKEPRTLIDWCNKNIILRNDMNTTRILMSPEGVWNVRVTDEESRDNFFVAVLRSLGIPARVDEVTGKVQYADGANQWVDVTFTEELQQNNPKGMLVADYKSVKALDNPLYYSHYTLSRFEDGTFRLMNFPEDESSSWAQLLKQPLEIDAGYYMLTTGTRLASGSVLANVSFFNVEPGKTTRIDLVMQDNPDEVKIIGNLNAEAMFLPIGKEEPQSLLNTTGRGYYIVAILGVGQEPTNHALRDIAALKSDFEQWGRGMVLLFPNRNMQNKFHADDFPGFPSTITWGIDNNGEIQKMIVDGMKLVGGNQLPIFVIADTFNRVVFVSQGYTIGLGEQLMKVIHKL